MNSNMFIEAITIICVIAFNLDFQLDKIQMDMITSAIPINIVNGLDRSAPNMLATIC